MDRYTDTDIPYEFLRVPSWDGLQIALDAWGAPSGPPVLLAHGGGQTRHAWGNTAETLARQGWYALSLDLRGHGDSEWSDDLNYGHDAHAKDLRHLVQWLGRPAAIVGASMGGLAGLVAVGGSETQADYTALVLVDVTPRLEPTGIERIRDFMAGKAEEGFENLDEAADYIAAYLPHRPRPKDTSGLAKNLRRHDDGRWRWHWDPRMFRFNERGFDASDPDHVARLENYARNLTLPVLLVRGRMSDIVSEETARAFLGLVPHAEYVDVLDAGHMVAGDKNDIFSAAIIDFLGRVGV